MTIALPAGLPSVATAKLPKTYEAAKGALEKCAKIDECKDWADKAMAMASYARQSKDSEMFDMARRIQARAIDKCGELLRQIPKTSPPGKIKGPGSLYLSPREVARQAAGLSQEQAKVALRVNSVPRNLFENLVEGKKPPTVKDLAERGKKKRQRPLVDLGSRTSAEFSAATELTGVVSDFVRDSRRIKIDVALRGCDKREIQSLVVDISAARKWLDQLTKSVRRTR